MPLNLNVDGRVFPVRRADQPLTGERGIPLLGEIDLDECKITISPFCPRKRVLETIGHEVGHAWLRDRDLPATEESFCKLLGKIVFNLFRDVERYGGTNRLLLMGKQEQVLQPEVGLADLNPTDRVEVGSTDCHACRTPVGPRSVVRGDLRDHERLQISVIDLAFRCGHCDHLVKWTEKATDGGFPSGITVDGQTFTRGEELAEFERNHPEESGVIQIS